MSARRRAQTTAHERPPAAPGETESCVTAAAAASRRFAALTIQAFRASPEASPLPPAARLALAIGGSSLGNDTDLRLILMTSP